jgi:hypothetical protein
MGDEAAALTAALGAANQLTRGGTRQRRTIPDRSSA